MTGHHSIQRCLVVRQGKTVRNQWRKLQQADAKEPHRICPGSRRGAKDTIDCQVLEDEDIALQAQMSACPCDALEENRSPSSRQAHREFDPGGAASSFKDQVCPAPLSHVTHALLHIIALAVDGMCSSQASPYGQALTLSAVQD